MKLRSSQVRAARLRAVAVSAAVAFTTLFGLYIVWRSGDWVITKLIYENRTFAIQEIDVQTDGIIAPDQLRRWAGVQTGQNLLALDLARVKRDLELVPGVQSVSIERVLPHTLRLKIIEREPVAQVSVAHQKHGGGIETMIFQLDPEGYVMLPLEASQRRSPPQGEEQFPAISGLNPAELQPGRRVKLPQVQAALQLIMAFDHSPMAGLVDLKRIDLSSPDIMVATTDQNTEVVFGLLNLDRQLRRWHEIFDFSQKMSKSIASVDLAVAENIPVRLQEAAALPPAGPRSPKILRARRKNV